MTTTPPLPSRQNRSLKQETRRRASRVGAATRALLNEMQKGLWLLWGQRLIVLTEFIALVAFYPLLQFLMGNGVIERTRVLPTLVAFLAYPLLFVTTFKFVGDLREEVNSGTFEQVHLSPFPPATLLAGRLVILALEGILIAVGIGVGMSWALGVSLPLRVAGALPAALTVIDILGFAFLIGGLALTLPQIGSIVSLFNGLIFLINGTVIPLEWYPQWVQTLARFLPTTLGIEVTQKVVVEQQALPAVWADGTLPWLISYTALLAAGGWLVFLLNDRQTIRRGISR